MAITGAHVLLYSSKAEEVRALLRDIFKWKHVDAGGGWLIFSLPPAEIGVHPSEGEDDAGLHQFSLMCDDIHATIAALRQRGVTVKGEPEDHGYGITVMLTLPGDLQVQLYEPRHPTAI
jgi:Glyoxalase/Bleomycin resistance protein/Dioxygenase superfamily